MERLTALLRLTGRDSRRPYWITSILASLVLVGLLVVVMEPELADNLMVTAVAGVFALASVYLLLAVSVRRLHDRGKSGWWMLIYGLVPVLFGPRGDGEPPLVPGLPETLDATLVLLSTGLSIWALIDMGILKGVPGVNRYGDNPLGPSHAEVFG